MQQEFYLGNEEKPENLVYKGFDKQRLNGVVKTTYWRSEQMLP